MPESSTPEQSMPDQLTLYDQTYDSRLLLGTALYPSPHILGEAVKAARPALVTVSLRRESAGDDQQGAGFWQLVQALNIPVLPNTAGCRSVKEAVTTARMAREVFETPRIKLEVIGNDDSLHPDVIGTVEAARILCAEGFQVFPYTTEDPGIAEHLLAAGCELLMPWGAPIGSGLGLNNPYGLKSLRACFPDIPLIIDAGIGAPSHAVAAMELGYDAILLNTAIARANDPVAMAAGFTQAVNAGRTAFRAGLMPAQDMAAPSTPVAGTPFLMNDEF